MISFMKNMTINVQQAPAATVGAPTKYGLLIGQRNTGGTLIPAKAGYIQPNYYVPFLLPAFQDGRAALQYLGNLGFKYKIGINFTLELPAPDSITITNGLSILQWTTPPPGFGTLAGFTSLSGTISQLDVDATLKFAQLISNNTIAQLTVYGNPAFIISGDDGDTMILTGKYNDTYPDPDDTDPIGLMVWDYHQTALSAFTSPNGAPACYISVLTDRDTTISPNDDPYSIGIPEGAAQVGSITTLTYPIGQSNLGYLSTQTAGITSLTQATSAATGIFGGLTIVGEEVSVIVNSTTGTFDSTHAITVVQDSSLTAFSYLDNIDLYGAVNQFPTTDMNSITTGQISFWNGIDSYNLANKILLKHYICYGISGNVTSMPNQAPSLPAPNDYQKILVTYPYIAQFGDIPYENTAGNVAGGRIASSVLYMLSNGDAPYPPLTGAVIAHLPVSSLADQISYSNSPGNTGDLSVDQGWLPLAPNSSGVVSFLQSVTTQITIPNTDIVDREFRYTHVWDCVRWIKRMAGESFVKITTLPNNQGTALMSPTVLNELRMGLLSGLAQGQLLGIVQNLSLYQSLVSVTQDSLNPNQVDEYIPAQIIPQINNATALINIFSSLTQFSNLAA